MTKKELRDPDYCSLHPEYGAKRAPRTKCARCLSKWSRREGARAVAPVFAKRIVNRVAFVVDRSGSTNTLMGVMMEALRKNVETISDLRECFVARGMTALFDSVGKTIRHVEAEKGTDDSCLFVVITDGLENASREFSEGSLARLMERVQATDRWTLTFLLPPGRKKSFLLTFPSIPEGNVAEWEGTAAGVEDYSRQTSVGTQSFYDARSRGLSSIKTFYTDMSKVKKEQVEKELIDVTRRARVWKVEREIGIREFCEKKSGSSYVKGAAFYALTKEEKVQPQKELLVAPKRGRSVYGGPRTRAFVGLPSGETAKVVPGNHADFDIYVQSTSVNRKLVRGTSVVYLTS